MLSLILPTYNEAANLPDLTKEVESSLGNIPFEVIVVDDDSPDGTADIAETLGPHVRVLRRVGRRGLSSAVIEGFAAAGGDVLAVMDADGQHDPTVLPVLYKAVRGGATVAVGSRYVPGGSVEGWKEARHFMSRVATALAWLVCPARVTDPMSGFFAIDRTTFLSLQAHLRPRGFKILLEILAMLPKNSRVEEFPLVFRLRRAGSSKLSLMIELQFFAQFFSLFFRRRTGTIAFTAIAFITAAILLLRLWNIRLLYLDARVRSAVTRQLNQLTAETGWLLSDIELREVSRSTITFLHREHRRGRDPERCIILYMDKSLIAPCNP